MKIFLLPKTANSESAQYAFNRKCLSRDEVDRASSTHRVSNENILNSSVSCDIDNRRCRVLAHFPHVRANASKRCRSTCETRAYTCASTLP